MRVRPRSPRRCGPRVRRRERGVEQLPIVIGEPPALHAAEQRREITQVRAGAGAEVDDGERCRRRSLRDVRAQLRDQCGRARRRVERLTQREPFGREAAHLCAPRPSSAAANFVGRRRPRRQRRARGTRVGGERGAARRIVDDAGERLRERAAVAGRDEHARVRGHGLGDRAGRRADDGQPERDGLGERHAVAFEIRRQHEHVGARVLALERLAVEIAEQAHALAQAQAVDLMLDRRDGRRVAQQAAGAVSGASAGRESRSTLRAARRAPCAASACRRRADATRPAARRARAAPFGSELPRVLRRSTPGSTTRSFAIGTPSAASVRAVHWLVVMTRCTYVKRAALERAVALGLDRVEARLERDGMMHERDELRGAAPRRRAGDRAPATRGRR